MLCYLHTHAEGMESPCMHEGVRSTCSASDAMEHTSSDPWIPGFGVFQRLLAMLQVTSRSYYLEVFSF